MLCHLERFILVTEKNVEVIGFETVFEDIRSMSTVHNENEIIHQVTFSIDTKDHIAYMSTYSSGKGCPRKSE